MNKADIYLENDFIKIGVNYHGAELRSLVKKTNDLEYLWKADKEFWGRTSPVLFPFVGKVNDNSYSYDGRVYENIPQHAFARDYDFELVEKNTTSILFKLDADETTKALYPFDFTLKIGYELRESSVKVSWTVENKDSKQMYFSIGAHPAFNCPKLDTDDINFDGYMIDLGIKANSIKSGLIGSKGTLTDITRDVTLDNGLIRLNQDTFKSDALILDGKEVNKVSILDKNKKPYLSVKFDMPLVGIWAPAKENVPFVCIEPWCGRCDRESFNGDLADREYGNKLEIGESFNQSYEIILE